MISHGNLLTSLKALLARVKIGYAYSEKDLYVAYLPLAHVLELCCEVGFVINGVRIGYSSPNTLTDQSTAIKSGELGDLRKLQPTIMTAVPTVLERLSKAVKDKVAEQGGIKKDLFDTAYPIKLKNYQNEKNTTLMDKIIFGKINATILGGRVQILMTGGAMLNKDVHEFGQACLCKVFQGYGLTETSGGCSMQYPFQTAYNEVGGIAECSEVRLVDWPEGNYRTTDKPSPRGEIWIGGANVTLGYYKMPDKTAEDFHEIDGTRYFATGDIGEMTPSGNLKIIDRKKDLVKLQGGEYVSLNKVESVIKLLPMVDNACVIANPSKSYCVCLISPNFKKMQEMYGTNVTTVNEVNAVNIELKEKSRRTSVEIMGDILSNLERDKEFVSKFNKEVLDHCLKKGLERF